MGELLAGAIIVLSLIAVSGYFYYDHWSLQRAAAAPFPTAWQTIVDRNLPIYRHLPTNLQHELQTLIKRFLHRKRFEGCGGLIITDEIRITIAATACLLLLNRPSHEYADLRWIYVYPYGFIVNHEMHDDAGVVSHHTDDLSGESWSSGKVILSWDDVEHGVRDFTDGHNVVLHEFAHQLDGESGTVDGAPLLYTKGAYIGWAEIFSAEFARFQQQVAHGHPTVFDHYGATDPGEFFAVATETFFERPLEMQRHHGALYQELSNYYRLDPATWWK